VAMLPSASVTTQQPPRIALWIVTAVLACSLALLVVRNGPLGSHHHARPASCEIRGISLATPDCP